MTAWLLSALLWPFRRYAKEQSQLLAAPWCCGCCVRGHFGVEHHATNKEILRWTFSRDAGDRHALQNQAHGQRVNYACSGDTPRS